jgi:hypothetical protein
MLNRINGANIVTSSAIGANILINDMLASLFADGVNGTNIVTSSAIGAVIGDVMSTHSHSPSIFKI